MLLVHQKRTPGISVLTLRYYFTMLLIPWCCGGLGRGLCGVGIPWCCHGLCGVGLRVYNVHRAQHSSIMLLIVVVCGARCGVALFL